MGNSRFSILIICEGENTEPLFFNSIRDDIINGVFKIESTITIWPEPKIYEQEESKLSKHKKYRKKRNLRKAVSNEPDEIKGVPPLKWVEAGVKELESGTFNEVWAVFDHDDHPTRKEAFETADKSVVNESKVNIAFSSRSFEYFLLLHFERKYKSFNKTECKEGKISIKCGTKVHPDDCNGELCINGYARVKKYWDESKDKKSMFQLVKDNIEIAFENSAWLRFQSNIIEKNIPIYNRNPYVSTDILVRRLTGRLNYNWTWISIGSEIEGLIIKRIDDYHFSIQNNTKITVLVIHNSFFRRTIATHDKKLFGKRLIIAPFKSKIIEIEGDYDSTKEYLGFTYNNNTILFEI